MGVLGQIRENEELDMAAKKLWVRFMGVLAMLGSWQGMAMAQDGRTGKAEDWQTGFQPAATEVMERITDFHNELLVISGAIVFFVFALMLIIILKFNRKANPVPSKVTHNTLLEVVWSVIPILILFYIGFQSIPLLFYQDTIPESDLVIKVTGHQWRWTYEYPDHGGLEFDGSLIPNRLYDSELTPKDTQDRADALEELRQFLGRSEAPEIYRLLDTYTRVVVPVNKNVKVLVTADDVVHSWAIPSFGIKIDAVPGRLNETWFNAREIGTYYGQCSELCGKDHAYMPIVVEVVSEPDFEAWLGRARTLFADGSEASEMRSARAAEASLPVTVESIDRASAIGGDR